MAVKGYDIGHGVCDSSRLVCGQGNFYRVVVWVRCVVHRHGYGRVMDPLWTDPALPWGHRVEEYKLWRQQQIFSEGVDRHHVPVLTYEDAERELMATVSSKDDRHEAQIAMLNERFAGLEGHLFGRDGTNGAFGELRADIKALMMTVDRMHTEMHEQSERYAARCAQHEQQMVILSKDVDAVGEIARDTRDSKRDTIKRLKAVLIGAGGTAAGAAIWAGIQALI